MRRWLGPLRSLLLLAVLVTFLVVLCVQFVSGDSADSWALLASVLIGVVYLLSWPPTWVQTGEPGRAPVIGAVLINLAWLGRMAAAIILTFLIARRTSTLVFDRQVAGFVLAGGLLGLVHLLSDHLAGIRQVKWRDWVRSAVNIPIAVVIGGFAQPLKVAAFYLLCWVPLAVYHGVGDGTGVHWFGVLVDIPVWPLWLILVFAVVSGLRTLLDRVFGPANPISAWLGDLKAEGEGVKAEVQTAPEHAGSVKIAPGLSQDWDPPMSGEPNLPWRRWQRRRG